MLKKLLLFLLVASILAPNLGVVPLVYIVDPFSNKEEKTAFLNFLEDQAMEENEKEGEKELEGKEESKKGTEFFCSLQFTAFHSQNELNRLLIIHSENYTPDNFLEKITPPPKNS